MFLGIFHSCGVYIVTYAVSFSLALSPFSLTCASSVEYNCDKEVLSAAGSFDSVLH